MSVLVPLVMCYFTDKFLIFRVITHYDNYNENRLLLAVGIRWWFGCHSVVPFLPGIIQGSSLLSKVHVALL